MGHSHGCESTKNVLVRQNFPRTILAGTADGTNFRWAILAGTADGANCQGGGEGVEKMAQNFLRVAREGLHKIQR